MPFLWCFWPIFNWWIFATIADFNGGVAPSKEQGAERDAIVDRGFWNRLDETPPIASSRGYDSDERYGTTREQVNSQPAQ